MRVLPRSGHYCGDDDEVHSFLVVAGFAYDFNKCGIESEVVFYRWHEDFAEVLVAR